MESNNPARSSSYSKLNVWDQGKQQPLIARKSKLSLWKRIFVGLVIVSCIVFIGLGIGFGLAKINQKVIPTQHFTQVFANGAVSSQSANCSIVGRDILKKGGSAVDAAIAALLCEGAYSPQSTGFGGGFFMMIYTKADGTVKVIDARETAPLAATADTYQEQNSTLYGGLAVAVPGELRGYQLAHQMYGHLNWSDLFQPAIRMCREGVTVGPRLGYSINDKYADKVKQSPSLRPLFFKNDTGKFVDVGDVFFCPELADTMELVAENGADELYTGETSRKLLQDLNSFGSKITADDLRNYNAVVREPVTFKLSDGIEVYSMPPPGSGLILGLLMQIVDKIAFNATYGIEDIDDFLWAHYFVEACKFAYAKRGEIGDPGFEDMAKLTKLMTEPDLAQRIKNKIQEDTTFGPQHYEAAFAPTIDSGTAHVSVLAPNGDAVSVTGTINTGFGAVIRSTSTGIILNNEMDDFSLPLRPNFYGLAPSPVNFIKPGKRPSSSMAPAIILDHNRELMYVLGASGGSKIVSAEAYVFMMHEYRNTSIENSILSKRLHHQLIPNEIEYEEGFDAEILKSLTVRGHDYKLAGNATQSAVYLIYRNSADGKINVGGDLRRGSVPAGF